MVQTKILMRTESEVLTSILLLLLVDLDGKIPKDVVGVAVWAAGLPSTMARLWALGQPGPENIIFEKIILISKNI